MDSIKLSNRKYIIKGFESKIQLKRKNKQSTKLEFSDERIQPVDELYMSPEILFSYKNKEAEIQFTGIDPSGDKSFIQGALNESSVLEPSFIGVNQLSQQQQQQQLGLTQLINEIGLGEQPLSSEDPANSRYIGQEKNQSAFYLHYCDIYGLGMVILNMMALGSLEKLFQQAKEQNISIRALIDKVMTELSQNGFPQAIGIIKEMIKDDYQSRTNERKLREMLASTISTRPSETRFKQQLHAIVNSKKYEHEFQKGMDQYKIRSFVHSYKILKKLKRELNKDNVDYNFYYTVIIALGTASLQCNYLDKALKVIDKGQKQLLSLVQFNVRRQNEIYLKLMMLKLEVLFKSRQLTLAKNLLISFWKLAKYY